MEEVENPHQELESWIKLPTLAPYQVDALLLPLQGVSRLPSALRNIVSDPIDKIANLALMGLGVQNFLDLELGQTVHVVRITLVCVPN